MTESANRTTETERTQGFIEELNQLFIEPLGVKMSGKKQSETSPATLVAIIVAARRAGDRELERQMRRELEKSFQLRVSFSRAADEKKRVFNAN